MNLFLSHSVGCQAVLLQISTLSILLFVVLATSEKKGADLFRSLCNHLRYFCTKSRSGESLESSTTIYNALFRIYVNSLRHLKDVAVRSGTLFLRFVMNIPAVCMSTLRAHILPLRWIFTDRHSLHFSSASIIQVALTRPLLV